MSLMKDIWDFYRETGIDLLKCHSLLKRDMLEQGTAEIDLWLMDVSETVAIAAVVTKYRTNPDFAAKLRTLCGPRHVRANMEQAVRTKLAQHA